jgi:hypothetical protein
MSGGGKDRRTRKTRETGKDGLEGKEEKEGKSEVSGGRGGRKGSQFKEGRNKDYIIYAKSLQIRGFLLVFRPSLQTSPSLKEETCDSRDRHFLCFFSAEVGHQAGDHGSHACVSVVLKAVEAWDEVEVVEGKVAEVKYVLVGHVEDVKEQPSMPAVY